MSLKKVAERKTEKYFFGVYRLSILILISIMFSTSIVHAQKGTPLFRGNKKIDFFAGVALVATRDSTGKILYFALNSYVNNITINDYSTCEGCTKGCESAVIDVKIYDPLKSREGLIWMGQIKYENVCNGEIEQKMNKKINLFPDMNGQFVYVRWELRTMDRKHLFDKDSSQRYFDDL